MCTCVGYTGTSSDQRDEAIIQGNSQPPNNGDTIIDSVINGCRWTVDPRFPVFHSRTFEYRRFSMIVATHNTQRKSIKFRSIRFPPSLSLSLYGTILSGQSATRFYPIIVSILPQLSAAAYCGNIYSENRDKGYWNFLYNRVICHRAISLLSFNFHGPSSLPSSIFLSQIR